MTATFSRHFLTGLAADRPSITGAEMIGTVYEDTDDPAIWIVNFDSSWILFAYRLPPGGTTGQVLAKASGTDADYGWVTP